MDIRSHSLSEIWQQISDGAKIIDVRTAQEYAEGHLQNSENIPHDQLVKHLENLSPLKDQKIVVYCKSGGRSDFAMKLLNDYGFNQVSNAGGYQQIEAAKPK